MIGGRHKYFWYLSLGLVVIVIALISSQSVKKEEPEQTKQKKEPPPVQLEIEDSLKITTAVKAKKATQISFGVIITQRGDDLLVLINKNIRLPATYEPSDLVLIDSVIATTKPGTMLRKEAANALLALVSEARKDDVDLIVLSAFRSYWTQQATFSMWVGAAGLASAQTFSAKPGHSQHQLGTTFDFTSKEANLGLTEDLTNTKEGKWMGQNASKFGFVLSYPEGKETITGYTYEPWHYRFIGVENAKKMIESGLILEEYLQKFGII